MIQGDLRRIYRRELKSLRQQIEDYDDEASLWLLPGGVRNSAGTLCLHLCGNLQHFIGAKLGGSGYERDREAEFSLRDVPRSELVAGIEETAAVVDRTLAKLTDEELRADYPVRVDAGELEVHTFLLHLISHLGYHLGQIDLHRRVVRDGAGTVPTVPFEGLFVDLGDS